MASLKDLAKMEVKMPSRKRGRQAAKPAPQAAKAGTQAPKAAAKPAKVGEKSAKAKERAPRRSRSAPKLRMPRISAPKLSLRSGQGSGAAVGLDVQPGYVAAVQVRSNGRLVIQQAVGRALPPETVREGEIVDETLLTETLRELFHDGKLPRHVRVGVANQRTVLRVIEMPPIDDRKALEAAVRFQAQDHMPMPLQHAVLDFQPMGIVDTPAGPRQRVVVVAAQREMVSRLLGAVEAAGLRPVGVDLSAFAMIRALHRHGAAEGGGDAGGASADGAAGSTLYLNVGGLTNLAIAEGLACRFTRMVSGGLESMASQLAERHSIPLADARKLLGTVDLAAPRPSAAPRSSEPETERLEHVEPSAETGVEAGVSREAYASAEAHADVDADTIPHEMLGEGRLSDLTEPLPTAAEPVEEPDAAVVREDAAAAEARVVLTGGVREIAGEVRNSLDFHRSQGGGEVREVVLSGAALEIEGFASALEAELGFPLVCRSVEVDGDRRLGDVSPERLTIAAGLAVEEAPA